MFLSTYLSLTVPEVDGCGLVSLRSIVLEHKMKEGLPTKNRITQEKQHMSHMKSLVNSNKYLCLKYKGKISKKKKN